MAVEDSTPKTFLAELKVASTDQIKIRLANKTYSDVDERGSLAREELLRRESASEAEQKAAVFRASAAAIRAADAAERSALAAERRASTAERATRMAIAALVVAIIAAIVSLFSLKD
jgi:hypothetical protein